jgi:hypothetical protein
MLKVYTVDTKLHKHFQQRNYTWTLFDVEVSKFSLILFCISHTYMDVKLELKKDKLQEK